MLKLTPFGFMVGVISVLGLRPIHAQTSLQAHATIHTFGTHRANMPRLHRSKAYGCYELRFPHTKLDSVLMDNPDGYIVQDRAEIKPHVKIRINDIRKDGTTGPLLTVSRHKQTLDFSHFLTDKKLWTHEVLNNTLYQLGRNYYSESAYRFFGLAKSHGKTYLGVCWYSAASGREDTNAVVFRLDWNGQTIEPTPVKTLSHLPTFPSPPLLLDTLPTGDMLLSGGGNLSQMNAKGEWTQINVSTSLRKKYPQIEACTMSWTRGPWLITGRQKTSGRIVTFDLIAQNAKTRRKVREYVWKVRLN